MVGRDHVIQHAPACGGMHPAASVEDKVVGREQHAVVAVERRSAGALEGHDAQHLRARDTPTPGST